MKVMSVGFVANAKMGVLCQTPMEVRQSSLVLIHFLGEGLLDQRQPSIASLRPDPDKPLDDLDDFLDDPSNLQTHVLSR